MGNCLVRIMKSDGKIVEYKPPPIKVLNQNSDHEISDSSLPILNHFLPPPSPKATKKKVRFSDEADQVEGAPESGAFRIKLVISKQELHDLLKMRGIISVNDMLSLVHDEKGMDSHEDVSEKNCHGWKPLLETIPEVN